MEKDNEDQQQSGRRGEKRRRAPMRRRPAVSRAKRARARSVYSDDGSSGAGSPRSSSPDSRRSDSPDSRRSHSPDSRRSDSPDSRRSHSPDSQCKYCGHRYQKRASKNQNSKTSKKEAFQKKKSANVNMISECVQIGSRSKMLSPLFIGSNETLQEQHQENSNYCEITSDMIIESIEKLSMQVEDVPTSSILYHLLANYPVNRNMEELKPELIQKLHNANLAGMIQAVPNDCWRLPTALEKCNRLENNHVTTFWRENTDTLNPLPMPAKEKPEVKDTGAGTK